MATFVQWCVFGILVVIGLQDGHTANASKDVQCKHVTLKSIKGDSSKRQITDNNGRPAKVTSLTFDDIGEYRCQRGVNLFVFGSNVVVEDGCSAKLNVCYISSDDSEPIRSSGCRSIQLLSRYQREDTEIFEDRIDYMEVEEQYEESIRCEKDTDFGSRGKVAYARHGCRGKFRVCFKRVSSEGNVECEFVQLRSSRNEPGHYNATDDDGKAAPIVSVELIRQFRDSGPCDEWRTYTYGRNVVTVKRGCSGRFKVCYRKKEGEFPTRGCSFVHLKSRLNYIDKVKVADDNSKIRLFNLETQDEGVKCIRDTNYGIKDGEIYASGGCKGVFKVCVSEYSRSDDKHKSECSNVYVNSWNQKEVDWTLVTAKDGSPVIITGIRLLREDSNNACFKGRTFFIVGSNEVHASKGCRAKIEVCYDLKRPK